MSEHTAKEWTLKELAKETDVTGRTIRFWISRGLVDPPLRAGRGAAYGQKHRDRILAVRMLQEKGLMLDQIRDVLTAKYSEEPSHLIAMRYQEAPESRDMLWFEKDGSLDVNQSVLKSLDFAPGAASASPASAPALPEPETWRSFVISPDVVVMLRAGAAPWRTKRLMSALRRFAVGVTPSNPKEDQDE